MLEINPIFLFILGGLINGSFVIPSKYIKKMSYEQIWLNHSLLGLAIIPWLILIFIMPEALKHYAELPLIFLLLLLMGGIFFGCGQFWFAQAIKNLGIALSFVINLGIAVIIGSLFILFYQSLFFSMQGYLVTLAVVLIILSLIAYYLADHHTLSENFSAFSSSTYAKGWCLASLAGITSGFQNIVFTLIALHCAELKTDNSFWIWPPFLLVASITMFWGFRKKHKNNNSFQFVKSFTVTFKNMFLIILMGLFFSGSLFFYSQGMSLLNNTEKMIGWPLFMLSIIFATQLWGYVYKEAVNKKFIAKLYYFVSLIFLVSATLLLSL